MTVVSPMIEPDRDAIKAHLDTLFMGARHDYPGGLIEIRFGPPEDLTKFAYFNVQESGVDECATFAANRNREGQNVYVGVNPRKPNTSTKHQASASDIEIAFYHFADIDKAESIVGLVERYGKLPPTMNITTGTVPNKRPHLYWRLEEPVRNLDEWTNRQRGLAQCLGGDSVVDPPRIMRLGGTVNFPTQKKLEKGYRVELTEVRTSFANERSDVTPDQIAVHYPYQAEQAPPPATGNTLRDMAQQRTRIADLIAACCHGDQWHNNMVRLVAHLASVGRTDAEILGLAAGITLPGYTVDQTLREMVSALRSARSKWNIPEPNDAVEDEEAAREEGDSIFELLDMDELEALPPPTWLIEELISDYGLSIVYGDPGAGKSFVVLDMALRIAFGLPWHDVVTKQIGVLYIAGEGSRGLGKRVKGWRKGHGLEGAKAPFLLLPVAVQLLDPKEVEKLKRTIVAAMERAGFHIGLVIIDTVSRAIAGQDENGQESMSMFIKACSDIQAQIGGAVIGVHHSGKDSSRGMRGSTVLLGGCDASIKLTKNEQTVTLEVEKQKDAEQAEPIYMTMKKVEWATGLGKEESTLVPVRGEKPVEEQMVLSKENRLMLLREIAAAWMRDKPWSTKYQTKPEGRFLPTWMVTKFGMTQKQAEKLLEDWLVNGIIAIEVFNKNSKASGLRVLHHPEDWK
jgi:RecA-family ATPase